MNKKTDRKPLVSVIVPAYNPGSLVKLSIGSLLAQNYENLEILLIDDGSDDGSSTEICRSFEDTDPRIIYIPREHEGVSAARNEGLRRASGKYVMFADADDYYFADAASCLVRAAEETDADWVVSGVLKNNLGEEEYALPGEGVFTDHALREEIWLLYENYMLRQIWGKLYKTEIIRTNGLLMREEMYVGEDLEWNCRYLQHVRRITTMDHVTYLYNRWSSRSLSQQLYMEYFDDLELQYQAVRTLFEYLGLWDIYEERVLRDHAYGILRGFTKARRDCRLRGIRVLYSYIRTGIRSRICREYLDYGKRLLPLPADRLLRARCAPLITGAVFFWRVRK